MAELAEAQSEPHALARAEVLQEAADIHSWYGDDLLAQALLDEAQTDAIGVNDAWRVSAAQNLVRLRRFDEAQRLLDDADPMGLSSEVAHRSRHLLVRALLAVSREDADAAERVFIALQQATAQRADFWASAAQLLTGLVSDVIGLNAAVSTIGQRDPALLNLVADQIATRLHELDGASSALVWEESSHRPARWRSALRAVIDDRTHAAQIQAARILDEIGIAEDVPRLRALAKSPRGRSAGPELGRHLARHLAPRVYVEDQGRVSIRVGDQLIPGTDVRRKVLSLLCFLLTRMDLSATRDQVLEALWPELEPDVAGNSLNQTVYFLRRVFDPTYRDDVSPEYVHHKSDVLWLDSELVASRSHVCRTLIRKAGATGDPGDVPEPVKSTETPGRWV
jgi:hypothetical protein